MIHQALSSSSDFTALWNEEHQQVVTRQLMNAMARPGELSQPLIGEIVGDCSTTSSATSQPAWAAIVAALVDQYVSLADPHELIHAGDRAFFGAYSATVAEALFVLCRGDHWLEDMQPRRGSLERPDLGATVIIVVDKIYSNISAASAKDLNYILTGPGIQQQAFLCCRGLNAEYINARQRWCADFPCGVDLIIVDDQRCVALPRSTMVSFVQQEALA